MIRNFEQVKKQLAELSDSINKFKSEQVQLKIVELIFKHAANGTADDTAPLSDEGAAPRKRNGRRVRAKKAAAAVGAAEDGKKRAPAKPRGNGPAPTLQLLIERGFFSQKRTIGDVVEYCKNSLARTIPMNQLSTPLARLVRDEKLTRSKNAENQFEYTVKK
jgi:hypothetical protein